MKGGHGWRTWIIAGHRSDKSQLTQGYLWYRRFIKISTVETSTGLARGVHSPRSTLTRKSPTAPALGPGGLPACVPRFTVCRNLPADWVLGQSWGHRVQTVFDGLKSANTKPCSQLKDRTSEMGKRTQWMVWCSFTNQKADFSNKKIAHVSFLHRPGCRHWTYPGWDSGLASNWSHDRHGLGSWTYGAWWCHGCCSWPRELWGHQWRRWCQWCVGRWWHVSAMKLGRGWWRWGGAAIERIGCLGCMTLFGLTK